MLQKLLKLKQNNNMTLLLKKFNKILPKLNKKLLIYRKNSHL